MAEDPNAAFYVAGTHIDPDVAVGLREVVDEANDERPVQSFLEDHPQILARLLTGGHGRWVIPQKRLSGEYIPDFVIGERSSIGFEWHMIELESPAAPIFTKSYGQSQQLRKGIDQVRDWRRWISNNQDKARRPRAEHGEGLTDINGNVPAFVFIGRDTDRTDEASQRLRQLMDELRVQIRSYDWLIRMSSSAAGLPAYRRSELD
ncbi:Shedu anti-phage system protein SduA domain-containing protein [Nocardia fluminea]|uniref:Shedu anti-phage system protein SduA domain-containing protein n=1 Tax=Nocardia fluminea TaxID=134984 RepID=UPI0033D52977